MKKLKVFVTTLCLVATLAFVVPTTAYAEDAGGPQGNKNSAPQPPPPPPPPKMTLAELIFWILVST